MFAATPPGCLFFFLLVQVLHDTQTLDYRLYLGEGVEAGSGDVRHVEQVAFIHIFAFLRCVLEGFGEKVKRVVDLKLRLLVLSGSWMSDCLVVWLAWFDFDE